MADAVKTAATAVKRQLTRFRLGEKQVFLPNYLVVFLKKEHLPPHEACFKVPLRFTKFDLRDYLWNLYDVEVKRVRSYVKQTPLTTRPGRSRSVYRPLPQKIMTVELTQPFQWPAPPADTSSWFPDLWRVREREMEASKQHQLNHSNYIIPLVSKQARTKDRTMLARTARDMLAGRVKWSNDVKLDPKWDAILAKINGDEAKEKKSGAAKEKKSGAAKEKQSAMVEETEAEKLAMQEDAKARLKS